MTHCYVQLGDRVWQQIMDIPIGFSCSPQWCNLYFISYKIKFLQRLARLQQHHFLPLFEYTYRYIDDFCTLNNPRIANFLDPQQPRLPMNPFWIYPLDIVSMQPEFDSHAPDQPSIGLSGHFLNVYVSILDQLTGMYETTKFDKRRALPFPFQQYIQFKSNRPIRNSYNIAISQTIPILYMANSAILAFQEIRILITTLNRNGFTETRLLRLILRFCSVQDFLGIHFQITDLCSLIDERLNS